MSYTPHTQSDSAAMLRAIGVDAAEDLFAAIPEEARLRRLLDVPPPLDEMSLTQHMRLLAARNLDADSGVCFLGAGIYDHFVPAVVDALTSRGEFATAYTPYQPEVSQGMLQAIYEFQSLICALTAMDLANASMYDAATALAEAVLMAVDTSGRRHVVVSRAVHPHYRVVLATYLQAASVVLREVPVERGVTSVEALRGIVGDQTACVAFQTPNFFGCLEDVAAVKSAADVPGALTVVATDPVSLGVLKPPGEYGVDIVVGEGQGLGSPMAFGGPLLGFFACKERFQRRFPGRIVGLTHDAQGRRGYTMTLRTREQDIRREKATSNICTNEALVALAATVHLCALGPTGLRAVAELSAQKAHYAASELGQIPGIQLMFPSAFFKEFVLRVGGERTTEDVCRALLGHGILAGYPLGRSYPEYDDGLLIAVTEKRSREEICRLSDSLRTVMGAN